MTPAQTMRTDPRSLTQALAELRAKLKALPLTHPARGRIAQQVVGIEDILENQEGLK